MPISDRWWLFSEDIIPYDKDEPGAYELGDAPGLVVYIGSSDQVRRRLREQLNEPASSCIRKNTTQYRVEYVADYKERERHLYDRHVLVNGELDEIAVLLVPGGNSLYCRLSSFVGGQGVALIGAAAWTAGATFAPAAGPGVSFQMKA